MHRMRALYAGLGLDDCSFCDEAQWVGREGFDGHEVEMQAPFGGRLKKWFEIIDRSTIEVDEENESPWEAVKVLLAKNRRRGHVSTEREKNVRLVTRFVARTRWDILIEGHDKKQLMALAAMAKEKN